MTIGIFGVQKKRAMGRRFSLLMENAEGGQSGESKKNPLAGV
jgi:hypothetical protein